MLPSMRIEALAIAPIKGQSMTCRWSRTQQIDPSPSSSKPDSLGREAMSRGPCHGGYAGAAKHHRRAGGGDDEDPFRRRNSGEHHYPPKR
jgi:hypothetical protein